MKMLKVLTLTGLLALSGCATYAWYRPNTTEAEFRQDAYQCEMQAAMAYPSMPMNQVIMPGSIGPSNTNCNAFGMGINCTTYPGAYTAPVTMTVDANQGNRNSAYNSCLNARGYRLEEVKG